MHSAIVVSSIQLTLSSSVVRAGGDCQSVSVLSHCVVDRDHTKVPHLYEEEEHSYHVPLCTAGGEGVDRGPLHLSVRQV